MTLSIEGSHACPNCGQRVEGRMAHMFQAGGKCTIVELSTVRLRKPNPIVGPLTRCPHCFETISEGTMHTRQTGGSTAFTRAKCTVTHVMRNERRVVSPEVFAQHAREDLKRGGPGDSSPGVQPTLEKAPRRPVEQETPSDPPESPTEGLETPPQALLGPPEPSQWHATRECTHERITRGLEHHRTPGTRLEHGRNPVF